MLEKPNLTDEAIIACLRDSYSIPVTGIEFLPVGNDATAWVYRVRTDDKNSYFLKVKAEDIYEPAVAVPCYLKVQGIEQVVAPLLTRTERLWERIDEFSLILYPFIEGSMGMQIGLTERQWTELGTALKKIHSTQLPAELAEQVQRETFVSRWADVVRQLHVAIREREFESRVVRALAALWKTKAAEITQIVDRTEQLGQRLQRQARAFVLCHTDIHTANVLLDGAGRMFIVDWDTPLLAPKERDLMFVDASAEAFWKGYGQADIDPVALAYYRYEWVVQEIGDFGNRVFLRPEFGEETKRDAVRGFRKLFQPGDVVEAAYRSIDF
jgi:spectinomycin phosphotransferase